MFNNLKIPKYSGESPKTTEMTENTTPISSCFLSEIDRKFGKYWVEIGDAKKQVIEFWFCPLFHY